MPNQSSGVQFILPLKECDNREKSNQNSLSVSSDLSLDDLLTNLPEDLPELILTDDDFIFNLHDINEPLFEVTMENQQEDDIVSQAVRATLGDIMHFTEFEIISPHLPERPESTHVRRSSRGKSMKKEVYFEPKVAELEKKQKRVTRSTKIALGESKSSNQEVTESPQPQLRRSGRVRYSKGKYYDGY